MPSALRDIRASKNLTTRGLAEKAGISPTTLFRIESGKTVADPITRHKLAAALEVPQAEVAEFAAESKRKRAMALRFAKGKPDGGAE